ncbi:MAG TPA: response regulator transcription factor, partial [Myxococcaceae bacterium]|nr:response regulator transcription factor [Myxococcaceae bacterium]
ETARLGVMLAILGFPMLSTAFRSVIDQEPDMRVVAEATGRESLVAQASAMRPDVILLECESVGGFGCGTYDSIEAIRSACPGAKIIALDCRCATEQFSVALKAGANGFLTREAQDNDVVGAVRSVAAGHTYVSPAIVTRMVETYVRRSPDALDDPYESLTERERQVLLLAAMGHTNRDIARSLQLSEQTVHYNRANVMEKLGLHDRVELLRYTVRRGLLNPSNL